jgi:hypothetical protein
VRTTASPVACLVLVALAAACRTEASPTGTAARPSPAAPAGESPAWTPDRIRQFVVETDRLLLAKRGEVMKKHLGDQAMGQCYGEPAYPMGKASDILPVLESRLTDKALRCYLASYFGCRLGDSIASAGVSLNVPIAAPFQEARAAILEQNADRVVAEVGEAEFNMVPGGKLDPTQADGKSELIYKSRYTLVRDAKGVWRISDRVPSFKEWECRER